jgi:hypothetical protein
VFMFEVVIQWIIYALNKGCGIQNFLVIKNGFLSSFFCW